MSEIFELGRMTPDLLRAIQLSCASAWLVEGRMPSDQLRRCKVIGLLGGAAAAWPFRAHAQGRCGECSSCCAQGLVAYGAPIPARIGSTSIIISFLRRFSRNYLSIGIICRAGWPLT